MNPLILIKRLIFPPKCAACDTRLSPFSDKSIATYDNACLCNKCYKRWREATGELCSRCAMPAYMCSCVPELIKKRFITFPSLFFYDTAVDNTQNRVIYTFKRKRNRELVSFLSKELYPHIEKELEIRSLSQDSIVFTWIPRSKSSMSKYGFDQSEELAREIAKQFKTKAVPILLRIGGREQKKLTTDERTKNLDKSVVLNHNLIGFPLNEVNNDISDYLKEKNVVIVDDIITTGASMHKAIDIISDVTDNEILIVSIAKVKKRA